MFGRSLESTMPISTRRLAARACSLSPGTRGSDLPKPLALMIVGEIPACTRKLRIVCLRANVVGISVYINRISLKSHQNPCDAVQDVAVFGFDVGLVEVEANRLAIERHHQSHRGEAGLRDLSKRLLQLCKFRFAFLAILLSLLRGFIRLLLLGGGLLARKLRLSLRVCLRLFRQVALLGGCLRVSSCLRSLLSQGLRLLLCALDQLPETLCLLIELRHLSLQATGRP